MLNLAINNFPVMLVLFAIMVISAVADLFKRHLLSSRIVYTITMLVAPFSALVSVITPISILVHKQNASAIPALLIGSVLFLLTSVIYIRGHIAPIDKNAVADKYSEKLYYCASKRLIAIGSVGTALYGLFFVIQAVYCAQMLNFVNIASLIFMIILLFIPYFNVGAMFFIIMYSAEFLALGILGIVVLIPNLLVTNGCIRCIVHSDKTKPKKALFIVLSFIPVFNIVYGIICLKRISAELK